MTTLSELSGEGWVFADPPKNTDEQSVIARYQGEKIKAGVKTETVTDNESEMHIKYRTGCYDLELKFQLDIVRGQIKVSQADGYE